jgi:hypothetical protein
MSRRSDAWTEGGSLLSKRESANARSKANEGYTKVGLTGDGVRHARCLIVWGGHSCPPPFNLKLAGGNLYVGTSAAEAAENKAYDAALKHCSTHLRGGSEDRKSMSEV